MKITLRGAAGDEVTGSAYLVQISDANGMVDCVLSHMRFGEERGFRQPAGTSKVVRLGDRRPKPLARRGEIRHNFRRSVAHGMRLAVSLCNYLPPACDVNQHLLIGGLATSPA
jgi:hypothetical protein